MGGFKTFNALNMIERIPSTQLITSCEVFAEEAYKSLQRSASAPLSKVVPAINGNFNKNMLSKLNPWSWRWPTKDRGISLKWLKSSNWGTEECETQSSIAQQWLVQPSTAKYRLVQPSTAKCHPVQTSTAQYIPVQPSTAQYSPIAPSTAQYSPVQSSTAQYSPLHPSTAQYSPVQPSSVQLSPAQPSSAQ